MKHFRTHRRLISSLMIALMAFWQIGQPLHAATFYWDSDANASGNNADGTGLGGTGDWDTTTANWWNLTDDIAWPNTTTDRAIFSGPFVAGAPTLHTVTLSSGIIANQLSFLRSGYTLTGGDITLGGTTPGLHANLGESATISSLIAGTDGLTMTGGGSIRLTNLGNSYTGATTIANGSLIISDPAALGGTGSVNIVTTNNTPLNTNSIGFGGGSLVLDGTAGGFTLARDVDFEGQGPIGGRGSAILSLGNNTLSGTLRSAISPLPLSPTATIRSSRINSVNGTLTLSGTLNVGGTAGTTVTSLGGINSAGFGNFSLTGVLAGTGTLEKSGAGTLFLNPSDTSGFSGHLRVSGSATGQQSSVRVTQATVAGTSIFGAGTGTTTASAIDLNGAGLAVLEFRNDGDLDFGALASGKNVYNRNRGIIFTGPAAGGAGINGTTTLGALHQNASGTASTNTTTFESRNGFGLTFTTLTSDASTSTSTITNTLTNNMGGTLRFTGNVTRPEGSTASRPRPFVIGGNGNTIIQGSIISGTDPGKTLTKSGSGNLTIQGVATTLAGTVSITGGAITITDFRSLTNNTAAISLGNATTTGGNLIIGGTGVTPTAGGLTTSKTITLNTTTASNSIYANQTGLNPVILNGAITKIAAATTGSLILGGTNTADNIINSVIPVETTPSTGGLIKLGAGTWVLNAANTFRGSTTIQNGTLKLRATSAASDVIGALATNTVVFSANATTGTAGGTLEFRGFAGAATTETLGALTPTAGAATIRLLGNGGSAADLTFTSLGATTAASSVNFDTSGALGGVITLAGQAATTATNLPGTANFLGHLYLNGADFATINGSAQVVAPTYAGAGDFQNAAGALVNAVHNKLTGSFTNGAETVSSLVTNSHTLTLSGNFVVSTGGILQSGGTATIQSDNATPRLINQTGTAARNVAIRVDGSSDVLNLGTLTNPVNIGSFTTGGLTKNGAGTLDIFGTNAQTGTTNINEGTVRLSGAAGRISATSANLVIRQGATLELNGTTGANATVAALDGAGIITNVDAAAATFIQTGAGAWNGIFQDGAGVLNVTKAGTTGAPTWSGLNTYTGVTTIGGTTGLLTVDHMANGGVASGIGASSSEASNLVFSGTSSGLVYRGSIIESALTLGSRSATTDRLFTLAGTGATLSSTASLNNAIVWSNTGAIVHGVTGPQTLVFTGTSTGDNTFNPQLTDSGVGANITSLTKTAAGQWNLGNSNNTYTGVTTVGNGILALNHNGALSANSALALGTTTTSGILQMSGTFERNLAAAPAAGIGTVTWTGTTGGGGFAAHSTALTVTLNGGAGLTWGSGGFVGTGGTQSLIFNSTSALADVTFTNAIDLGAAVRTITVNDNVNTGADYATVSGVLSGAGGGLLKNGNGILRVTGANSYTGTTGVSAGTLVVSSLGSSTGGGTSSVGAGGVAMDNSNAINLGAGGNNAGILQYVGPGETSDRKIRFNSTTGTSSTNQIHADGSGPLILTNVANDMAAGAKSVVLRGSNTAGNMITSQLSDNGGALSITVDGGATWILTNSANNYTGTTTASAGALGIGHDTAIGAALTNSNGNIFAYGGDRTLLNTLNLANNATSGFIGDYSLTFNGTNNLAAGANNLNLYNSVASGKAVTFNGLVANALTGTRAWALDGSGETVINGNFTTTTGFGANITKSGNGTLTLGTSGAGSNWNQANNVLDLDRGTLKFTANEAIPTTFGAAATTTSATVPIATTTYTVASTADLVVGQTFTGTNVPAGSRILTIDGPTTFTTTIAPTTAVASGAALSFAASGGLTISPEVATTDTATVDLNGTTQTVNALTATSNGTLSIDNTSATAATFRFGANNTNVDFGSGVGTYSVLNTGDGALSLVKLGNTTANFISGITLAHEGITASEGGGVWNIASPLTATTGLRAIEASTLSLSGGLTSPGTITSIEVGAGSTLGLLDGAGSAISNLTTLSLGNTGTGTVTLNLNVGDLNTNTDRLNTDSLTLLTGGTLNLGNTITFNLTDAGLNANQTYTLLNLVDGGLTAFGIGSLIQGATPGGFDSFTWNVTNNLVQLSTGNLIVGDLYWRGTTDTTWNANANNWSTDKAGTAPAASIPGQGSKVIFAYDGVGAGALTTTLEQNFKINSLVFEAGATTPASVTINAGVNAASRLEIAPSDPANGIAITAGGPAAVTIAANLKIGTNQTWSVVDSGATLTLGGALFGEADVTKTGAGRVILSGAADPTFNSGVTTDFTISGGNLEITNLAALGTVANSNLANVIASGGGFYYNNATSGTIVNPMTLAGGTLSAGRAAGAAAVTHTYSGNINITADSFINLRNGNSSTLATVANNITLSGLVSGSGALTVSSDETGANLVGGNAELGTFTINNAGSTWAGPLTITSGSVDITAAASPTVTPTDVTFDGFGRLIVRGVNAQIIDRTDTLNFTAGTIGEYLLDNTSGTLAADFEVNQNGQVNIGSGGTGASARFTISDAATRLNIVGPVVLGGNSSISVDGGDADSFTHISGVISDGGSGYSLAVNDDAGGWGVTNDIIRITGLNTFTGNISVSEGALEFNTVTNISGGASSLGNGSAISLGGGNLRFIGGTSQSTNRPISTTASSTLSANGTGGASITYTGPITQALNNTLTLSGTDNTTTGFITGGITQTGTAADISVNSGNWTISGAPSVLADDIIVINSTAVLNLNGASLISFTAGTSNGLYARTGATINLLSNDIFGPANSGGLDFILLGDNAVGVSVLNTNTFSLQTLRLDIGNRTTGYEAQIDGTGTLTITGTGTNDGINAYRGTVNANLASAGTAPFEKLSIGTVTLKGDNSGLASTGSSIVYEGTLVLDYSANTATKLRTASALDMRGSNLTLNGNASSAVAQSVGSFTTGTGGNSTITLNTAGGQDLVLNLNAITRAVNAQDGTVRFNLPSGTQSATNGITTDTLNTLGTGTNAILGGWATVTDSTGTFFARNLTNAVDGNIVAAVTTLQDDVSLWLSGENISDSTGFTGTRQPINITSLRFNAAAGSDLTLAPAGVLGITSGGVLVTSNVGGTPTLMNGTIFSGAQASNVPELIITQDSASTFEINSDIRTNSALTKSGTGTLLLSGNNVYTGTTEIQNGILQLSGGNAIGDTSLVTLATYRNSTLELLADETIGRLQGGQRQTDSDNGVVNVGTHTLTINQSASTTYSGRFNGSGVIVLNAGSTGNLNYAGQTSTGLFTGSVIVNGGLFQLSGDTARLGSATSFTINGSGNFLLDNNATANTTDRISDTATFTLNSAAGPWSSETRPRGLANRNDDNDDAAETIGLTTFNSGASYLSLEASGGSSSQARIVSTGWARNNAATVNVRGRNLGATSDATGRTQFKVQDANDAAMLAANVGGGGTIGGTAKNVSIIPWAIGESLTAALADGNMGNTFLSYVDNRGFVPLNLTNEFSTFAAASSGDNVRESLGADLLLASGPATTINSLILNNTAFVGLDVTGAGVGESLAITSGALMFTVTGGAASTAYDTTLGGFDSGITVGGTNEYVIHVVNPSSATTTSTLTATIASPLTSSADITKSGRGTLILSGTNTAGGGANKTTLNEGLLQISDLDNIGGNSGALVFAGGGLRFGAGLTDDISLRTISILQGGATLDTNGVDLALANSIGSGVGGLTKTGTGNLTLNGTATYTGNTVLSVGTITVGAANALGNGGNLTLAGGTTLALGTNSLTHGLVTTSGASPAITGTGTLSASTGFFLNHTGDTTIDAVLAGTGGVLKAQTNVVTLTAASTYTGITEVQAGTLSINSIANVGGGASALGAPTTAENGIIRMGLTTAATTLTYTGSGHTSDRLIGMQGTTGGVTLNGNGTGAVGYGGARFENAGNKTLTLRGTSDPALINTIGALQEIGGVLTLNKTDANTWQINQASSYTGVTQVDNGTLQIGVTDALPTATTVRIGTGSTAGTLDLNGFNQTIGSLLVQTNSTSVTNQLIVDPGDTLTVTGNVTIGANAAASTTLFNATGGGSFVNTNSGGTFQVGGGTGTTNVNAATADFSGLANFTADLGPTGTFRVGDNNTNSAGTPVANSSLILASTANTITAGTLQIGQGAGQGASVQTLTLGAGTNVINADTLNIGGNTTRSGGAINFAGATGSVTVRAADGTSRAVVNMTNGGISTGFNQINDFLLAGHTADVLVSTLTMASRSASTGSATATLSFDQGTLDVTTLNMAQRTGAGTGNATATVNLGDSVAPGVPTVTIGTLNMAVNTSAGGAVTADLNITGGNVTIGAMNLANAGTGRTVTSNVTLTGGTVTLSGNITRTGGAGTENETLTLNGSTLNMSGNSIGTSGTDINFAAQSGTLTNLAELNGGGALTKTTTGLLILEGANTYTGATDVNAGILQVGTAGAGQSGSGTVTVASGATLAGMGMVVGSTIIGSGAVLQAGDVTMAGDAASTLTGTGTLTFTAAATALTVQDGGQIRLGVSSPTLDNTVISFANGVFTFNGTDYGTAKDLFDNEATALTLWNVAPASQTNHDYINLTGMGSTLSIGDRASGTFGDGSVLVGGMLGSVQVGQVFNLIDWSGAAITGNFDLGGFNRYDATNNVIAGDLDLMSLGAGFGYDVSAFTTYGIVVIVPEPSRALLLLLGLFGLMLRRRRR